MTLLQLEYFQAVCCYNSVTKAAQMLHISQSSISSAIRELEAELGVNLFTRVKQRLILTSEGEFFLNNIDEILSNLSSLQQRMITLGRNQNHLRIAVTPMSGACVFIPLYLSYIQKYPSARIEIVESDSKKNFLGILDETYDIVLMTTDKIENNQLDSIPLAPVKIVFCVSRNHPLAQHSEITFEMLRDVRLVLFRNDSKYNKIIHKHFEELGICPNVVLYSNQIHTVQKIISSGHVGAFVFDGVANLFPDFVPISVAGLPQTTVNLVWKKEKYINNRARYLYHDIIKFIDYAREYSINQKHIDMHQ